MPTIPYSWHNLKNKAKGELSADITSGATSFSVKSGQGATFPASDFVVTIELEEIYVTTRSTDSFTTITRGYNGTTAAAHVEWMLVSQSPSAALFKRIQDNISEHTTPKADIPDFAHTHPQGDITNLTTDLSAKEATANKNAASGYAGLSASSKLTGSQQAYGTGVNTACEGNDGRLSDARTPTAHATSHQPGGGDAMAVDASAGTGSLRTIGTGALTACAGNDARLSDARTPTTHNILTAHNGFPGGTTNFLRADGSFAAPPGGGGASPAWHGAIYGAFGNCDPNVLLLEAIANGTVAATPTNITTTVARIAYFRPPAAITVNKIRFRGVGATTNVYRTAIYNADTLARLTSELAFTTSANLWGEAGSALGLALTAGQLYFIAVAANATGTTAGMLCVSPTVATTTGLIGTIPKSWPGNLDLDAGKIDGGFAQFPVTAGALPTTAATIVGQAAWTGGFPMFFLDNNNA